MTAKSVNKQDGYQAPVFEKEYLIGAAAAFGTTPEVMAGALYTVNESITQDEAEQKLAAYLKRPIKRG